MKNALLWKFALIVAVIGIAAFLVYPPDQTINLGLDLQGGSYILMQVDTDSAMEYELNLMQTRIGQALTEEGITYQAIAPDSTTSFQVSGVDPARVDEAEEILESWVGQWEISDRGDGNWKVSVPPMVQQSIETAAIQMSVETIRNRVDGLGVKEPVVQTQGLRGDRILVQMPGVEDPLRAVDVITSMALLEWKAVSYPPGFADFANFTPGVSPEATLAMFGGQLPADTVLVEERRDDTGQGPLTLYWPLKRVSVVAGPDLQNAFRDQDRFGEPAVGFSLTRDAAGRFREATRANLGRRMAIVLDGRVLSAPVIEGVIGDRGIIRGGYSVEEADDFALKLKSGSIPTEVTIIENRTVGPSLGHDSIKAGVTAAIAGFAGVLLFMVIYYRLAGINAVIALALNVLLVLGAMAYFSATLTLPGIAGLILTVGMAVDSNVLIFERIREELSLGKTVRSAVDQGFGRAFMTILDCNVTTLVAAFFLFSYGTGPVKGFAVTLITGLTASMFTAVFVSRQLFELVLGRARRVETLSI